MFFLQRAIHVLIALKRMGVEVTPTHRLAIRRSEYVNGGKKLVLGYTCMNKPV